MNKKEALIIAVGILFIAVLIYSGCGPDKGGSSSSNSFSLITPTDNSTQPLQPVFTWSSFNGFITSYNLQISTDINFGAFAYNNNSITPGATSFALSAITLDENTVYYWRIIAVDGSTGFTKIAANAPFKLTTGVLPGAFSLGGPESGVTGTSTTLVLTWTASAGVANYVVQISVYPVFTGALVFDSAAQNIPIATESYTILPGVLDSLVRYYWRIIAVNATGQRIAPTPTTGWNFTTQ